MIGVKKWCFLTTFDPQNDPFLRAKIPPKMTIFKGQNTPKMASKSPLFSPFEMFNKKPKLGTMIGGLNMMK